MPVPEPSKKLDTFMRRFNVPIRLDEDETRHRYLPVAGVFRGIPFDQVERWLMHPNGQARGDQELAAEVLLELRQLCEGSQLTSPLQINLVDVIEFDEAAAVIMAAFLTKLPSRSAC